MLYKPQTSGIFALHKRRRPSHIALLTEIEKMTIRYLAILAAGFLAGSATQTLPAQTCRVAVGVAADGSTSYMEVYEYDYVEEKPRFPGGDCKLVSYINEHRRYPAEAYQAGVEGRVLCSFVVNTDGNISNVAVLRGVEKTLNKEAVRILSRMPNWTPGKLQGQNVPVRVVWAVPFRR